MGIIHDNPIPLFQDMPFVGYGQYAQDHKGVSCQQIAETILTSAAANIDFTNIPGVYRDLLLTFDGRSDGAGSTTFLMVRFNGDTTGGNYDSQRMYGNAASVAASELIGSDRMMAGVLPTTTPVADASGFATITIPDYARAVWTKRGVSSYGWKNTDASSGITVGSTSFFWHSTAAITQITLFPSLGNIIIDSRATLWGLV